MCDELVSLKIFIIFAVTHTFFLVPFSSSCPDFFKFSIAHCRNSVEAFLIDEGEVKTFGPNEVVTELPENYHIYVPNAIICRLKNALPNSFDGTWSNQACEYFKSLLLRLKTFSLSWYEKSGRKVANLAGEMVDEYEIEAYYLYVFYVHGDFEDMLTL
jgi:hypothetical protein